MVAYVKSDLSKVEPVVPAVNDVVVDLMRKDERVVLIGADTVWQTLTPEQLKIINKEFPDRLINVGIAEAQACQLAAGMADRGMIPYWGEISAGGWLFMRAYNQIKQCIATDRRNVKMLGTQTLSPASGPSHQAIEDLAALRAYPGIMIVAPADAVEAKKAVIESYKYYGPVLIRYDRTANTIFEEGYPFQFGKAYTVREGTDLTIIGMQAFVYMGMQAADILAKEGIEARVINMSTIKPLDEEAVLKAAKETGGIVTAETASILGGLGEAVAATVCENEPVPIKRIGMRDRFGQAGRDLNKLLADYNMTVGDIVAAAKDVLKRKK
ncbi:MAG: transketolase C-terminal domain-containing protein [Candidatus Bathyarchaeia archaeon]